MPQVNAIEVKGLRKSYGALEVLKGIDLSIPRGKVFALLGPNGAGKTTTVRILTTLLQADEGTLFINGVDVREHPDQIRSQIGLTGQNAAVDEKLTGIANLEMIGRLYHLSKTDATTRAQELIERFELVDAAERPVKTYSGGMRRRLDLAASLIVSPPILFLDEPTTGLDPNSRNTMWSIIKELVKEGTTLLLTTQYLEEADQLADQIAVIDHGVVIALGTADELKAQVGGERLELTMNDDTNFEAATKVLRRAASHVNTEKRSISIEITKGVDQLQDILKKLKEVNVEVESFSMHRPTLDDVFLKLTGHQTEDPTTSAE